jgi:hypothetical protein
LGFADQVAGSRRLGHPVDHLGFAAGSSNISLVLSLIDAAACRAFLAVLLISRTHFHLNLRLYAVPYGLIATALIFDPHYQSRHRDHHLDRFGRFPVGSAAAVAPHCLGSS